MNQNSDTVKRETSLKNENQSIKQNNKQRKSNIELLRIISMLLIISFHYVYESGYEFAHLSYNSFIVKTFYMFGELGVNIFILITGYFMVNGKFSVKKVIYLVLEVYFYYAFSILLATKLGISSFEKYTIRDYVLLFFPIIRGEYWFFTVYILLYIISPYLNILIHNLNKGEYKKLLTIMLILWCIIPTILGIFYNTTESLLYYSRFIWAIVIYFIGAYIRLHKTQEMIKPIKLIMYALGSFILMLVGILIIYKFRNTFKILGTTEVAYFWTPNTILMAILSVSIFEIFLKIKLNYNKFINKLASTTLGIYLIHDGILQNYIWQDIFKTAKYLNKSNPVTHIFITVITLFIVGAIIDLIRQFIEKYTIKKFLESNLYHKISAKLSNISTRILE